MGDGTLYYTANLLGRQERVPRREPWYENGLPTPNGFMTPFWCLLW
ncbi:hypothetical protein FRUB_06372 [Fimbriiglobus ruber]|uniref:Uncharacterized protein n=1 Tax=Fimbriiglobus ruber TaxID=1908690 RepID=A0A225DRZ0_9BACT|nr:hypothetical protein FRUB_06372 [Fimbriiglobus ruber]